MDPCRQWYVLYVEVNVSYFYQTTVKIASTSRIKTVVSPHNRAKYNRHLETHQIHVELCLKYVGISTFWREWFSMKIMVFDEF